MFVSLLFFILIYCLYSAFFQDNVFVTVVASIQYRALAEKASDAFYKLSNTREQIQAYVFDGILVFEVLLFSTLLENLISILFFYWTGFPFPTYYVMFCWVQLLGNLPLDL